MAKFKVGSQAEWQVARATLLEKEKAATQAMDALAAARKRLPVVLVDQSYRFDSPNGPCQLLDLFEGRKQLITYHHMLKANDDKPCAGCCMCVDGFAHPAHLHARDTTLALVSTAPQDQIHRFKARMGWHWPWYTTGDQFNSDFGVTRGFGLNVFVRDDENIYHSYFTTRRGVEHLGSVWSLLDLTPLGRQELWEDAPIGWPQHAPYQWWRLHDEYS